MRKYLMEFIGTFFLVVTIGSTVLAPNDAGAMAPLAIGAILIAMVFAGRHVSGAQYNPAVTLALFLRGATPASDVAGYIVAQCAGAGAGAWTAVFFKGAPALTALVINPTYALAGEFLFTFALCTVVLNVATSRGTSGNSFYSFAIGLTVLAGAYAMGPVSGAAFNPAVVLGMTSVGAFAASNMWIYLVANFAAAAAAAMIFRFTESEGASGAQRAA